MQITLLFKAQLAFLSKSYSDALDILDKMKVDESKLMALLPKRMTKFHTYVNARLLRAQILMTQAKIDAAKAIFHSIAALLKPSSLDATAKAFHFVYYIRALIGKHVCNASIT